MRCNTYLYNMKIKKLKPSEHHAFLWEYTHIFQIVSRGPPTKKLSTL